MADVGYIDLHTHTTASDGVHSPREVVRLAKEAGLAGVAITDHDTMDGLPEAREEGAKLGVIVVPGVEISTALDGKDIHVLGYFADDADPVFRSRLSSQREVRGRRNAMILDKLAELGIFIAMEEVEAVAARLRKAADGENPNAGRSVGRPHIAQVLVERGIVASVREAFERYLGEGGAAHVVPPRITPAEAVRWIREAGGKAVLAHPGIYGDDELVLKVISDGIDGIEVRHSDHSPEEEKRYAEWAERFGLAATAGSDFHGSRQGELLHGRIGERRAELSLLGQLRSSRSSAKGEPVE